jgi:hypothetical protein
MLRLSVQTTESGGAAELRQRWQSRRPVVLQVIASQLLRLADADFATKSRGGRGADGVIWTPLKPATLAARRRRSGSDPIRIGVVRGRLRPGAETSERSVVIRYSQPHAAAFDRLRPLLPNSLPEAWRRDIEQTLHDVVNSDGKAIP